MIGKFITGKTYIFIDAANILYSQQTLGWRVDYGKLKGYLKRECNLVAMYFYTGRIGVNHKQNLFIKKLERIGYTVRAKEVKFIKISGGNAIPKGNLDIELALDAFRLLDNYDTLLLFSGDSDFAYLLDLLKEKGKKVLVASTRGHISKELLNRAKYIDIRKLRAHIEKNQEPDEPALEV